MHTVQLHATQQITEVVPMLVKLLHLHVCTSFICMAHLLIISTEKKKRSTNILCTALTQDFTKSLPNHFKWQVSFLMYNHIPYIRFSFSFFVINEAANEENNQYHQGYATQNSSTNDSSSINRRGVFTCNNQNSKKKMWINILCICTEG